MIRQLGTGGGQRPDDPLHTITGLARYGLVTVTIAGETYAIVDIGLRMLQPHELALAQGFPADYRLPNVKRQATALVGNSVCPQVAQAIVEAQLREAFADLPIDVLSPYARAQLGHRTTGKTTSKDGGE